MAKKKKRRGEPLAPGSAYVPLTDEEYASFLEGPLSCVLGSPLYWAERLRATIDSLRLRLRLPAIHAHVPTWGEIHKQLEEQDAADAVVTARPCGHCGHTQETWLAERDDSAPCICACHAPE